MWKRFSTHKQAADGDVAALGHRLAETRGRPHSDLTPDQERRLLTEEFALSHSFDFLQSHLVITVDVAATTSDGEIQSRFDRTLSRHPALQSTFEAVHGAQLTGRDHSIVQAFHSGVSVTGLHRLQRVPRASSPVTKVRLSPEQLSPCCASLIALVLKESPRPFALDAEPLIRATIVDGDPRLRLVVLTADRLVADWPSMAIICGELADSHLSAPAKEIPWRPPRTQRSGALGRRYAQAIRNWAQLWASDPPEPVASDDLLFALPDDYERSLLFGIKVLDLPSQLVAALRRAAKQMGITVKDVLLGATVAVIQHATQRSTVSLWTEFRFGEVGAVGALSHLHVLTARLTSATSPWDAVTTARDAAAKADEDSQVPLDLVWRARQECLLPRNGYISFQHVDARRGNEGTNGSLCIWPLLDSIPNLELQVRSCDDGVGIVVYLNYRRYKFSDGSASTILADLHDTLVALARSVPSRGSAATVTNSQRPDDGIYDIRASSDNCHLCARRRARRVGRDGLRRSVQEEGSLR
jgi:hypothetical protein